MSLFDESLKLRALFQLKDVYRKARVKNRQESDAEHTWGCLMLASYLVDKFGMKIDKSKVYEMITFHDIVEIETGDIPITKRKDPVAEALSEAKGIRKLSKKLPKDFGEHLVNLHTEFEEMKTPEAQFAKIIDCLDTVLYGLEIDKEYYWSGWTEEFFRKLYEKRFSYTPELKEFFESLTALMIKEGNLTQNK